MFDVGLELDLSGPAMKPPGIIRNNNISSPALNCRFLEERVRERMGPPQERYKNQKRENIRE